MATVSSNQDRRLGRSVPADDGGLAGESFGKDRRCRVKAPSRVKLQPDFKESGWKA